MRLWCDGCHSAPENMRRDRDLLAAADGDAAFRPVLRLFGFEPPGITVGRSQNPAQELDLDRCQRDGIAWAVRPTGGRTIFHQHEWTFSLVARIADPQWGGSLRESCDRMGAILVGALERLGVSAEQTTARRSQARRPRSRTGPATPCFGSTARHEVVLGGKKLIGSAQRRTRFALLQQGSLLTGPGHLRLVDYLALSNNRRVSLRRELEAAATDVRGALGGVGWAAWTEAVFAALPGPVERLRGAEGLALLTPAQRASYAAASPHRVLSRP